jgi:hypothetical protein
MPTFARLNSSFLVRTDFTSDTAWRQVCDEASRENDDGFRAYLESVSDPAFDGPTWETVKAAVPASDDGASVLFIADSTALAARDHPVLVVDLLGGDRRRPIWCVPPELWSVDNNLNIANMDWEEFADPVDESGVFRGFGS